jgi:hypothetical protein
VFPVRYELRSYIPEDGILHSHRRENLKSYTELISCSVIEIHFPRLFYKKSVLSNFLKELHETRLWNCSD